MKFIFIFIRQVTFFEFNFKSLPMKQYTTIEEKKHMEFLRILGTRSDRSQLHLPDQLSAQCHISSTLSPRSQLRALILITLQVLTSGIFGCRRFSLWFASNFDSYDSLTSIPSKRQVSVFVSAARGRKQQLSSLTTCKPWRSPPSQSKPSTRGP